MRRVKISIFHARIDSKTASTIPQNKDHPCSRPSANDLLAFGFELLGKSKNSGEDILFSRIQVQKDSFPTKR